MATRRSREFQVEIRNLMDALESDTVTASERLRITEILLKNTTDNKCMVNAAEDEPVFVLRAKDPVAAATVATWAMNATPHHEPEKVSGALGIADHMEMWKKQYETLIKETANAKVDFPPSHSGAKST